MKPIFLLIIGLAILTAIVILLIIYSQKNKFTVSSKECSVGSKKELDDCKPTNGSPCVFTSECYGLYVCLEGKCVMPSLKENPNQKEDNQKEDNQKEDNQKVVNKSLDENKKDEVYFLNTEGNKIEIKTFSRGKIKSAVFYDQDLVISFDNGDLEFIDIVGIKNSIIYSTPLSMNRLFNFSGYLIGFDENKIYRLSKTATAFSWVPLLTLKSVFDVAQHGDHLYIKVDSQYHIYEVYKLISKVLVTNENTIYYQGNVRFGRKTHSIISPLNKQAQIFLGENTSVVKNIIDGDFNENDVFIGYGDDKIKYIGRGIFYRSLS